MVTQRIRRVSDTVRTFLKLSRDGARVYGHRLLRRSGRYGSSSYPSKTLIFHIGFRKTGTSSIQKLFSINESVLRRNVGISTRFLHPSTDALKNAGDRWSRDNDLGHAITFEAAAIQFGKDLLTLPHDTVIISDENIIGHNIVIGSEDIFAIASRILKRLETTLSNFDIQFVVYTRQRDAWLKSCYAQDVKWHRYPGTFETWIESRRGIRNWDEGYSVLCDNLKSKVTFVRMEDELNRNTLLGTSLLKAAHLTPSIIADLEPCPPQNTSLSPVQLEFMRKINELGMSYHVTQKVADVVAANQELFRT